MAEKIEAGASHHVLHEQEVASVDSRTPARRSSRRLRRKPISLAQRVTPLVLVIISTSLAAMFLAADNHGWLTTSRSFAIFVEQNRADVTVAIQVISTVLGFLWTFSVALAFNLTVRAKLMRKSTRGERLRLYIALSRRTFDLSLPAGWLLIALVFFGTSRLPIILWGGGLTPQTAIAFMVEHAAMIIPDNSNATMPMRTKSLDYDCDYLYTEDGTFSNCPVILSPGLFVARLGISNLTMPKINAPGWTMLGRSYGVGSSVGLTDVGHQASENLVGYTFTEIGLRASIKCAYNDTADWKILFADDTSTRNGVMKALTVEGKRPNEYLPNTTHAAISNSYTIPSFDANAISNLAFSVGSCCGTWDGHPPYQLSIAAGEWYKGFNRIQCDLDFVPWLFNVSADVEKYTMSVDPINQTSMPIRQQRARVERVLRNVQAFTQAGTSLYTSSVGQAFLANINDHSINGSRSLPAWEAANHPDVVARSLQTAMDDIMMSLDSYTLASSNISLADMVLQTEYMVIGSKRYHLGLLVINVVALVAIISVMFWTMAFADASAFDFADLVSMVVAAHNDSGVNNIAWDGDAMNPKLNRLRVDLSNAMGHLSLPSVQLLEDDDMVEDK